MKLSAILLFICALHASATGFAQKVTFSGKNVPIEKIFPVIEAQTGYLVFCNYELLSQSRPVTLSAKEMPMKEFLTVMLKGQPLEYAIERKTIVISRKPATAFEPVAPSPSAEDTTVTVTGKVTAPDGTPIPGATILIKNTNYGAVTDGEGRFTFWKTRKNDVLIARSIGYQSREIVVRNKDLTIVLNIEDNNLDAVTVSTGYWTTEKRKSVGNISRVNAREIENQPVTSPLLALQGRVAGVEITPSTGVAGSAPRIFIRGENSLRTLGKSVIVGTFPLYIIDGVPVEPAPLATSSSSLAGGDYAENNRGFDPLSTIDPNSIESIQILKDADATAIYGSRGANGVILVTTKNRRPGERSSLDINFYRGAGALVRKMPLLNRRQYLDMRYEAYKNDNRDFATDYNGGALDLLTVDTTRTTDWQETLMGGTSQITDAQVNFSAGSERTGFNIGGGYHRETTIFPGDFSYSKFSARLGAMHRSADNKFSVNFTASLGIDDNKLFSSPQYKGIVLSTAPTGPALYLEDGSLNWWRRPAGFPLQGRSAWRNPLADLNTSQNVNVNNIVSSLSLNYELGHGISLLARLGYTKLDGNDVTKMPISAQDPYGFNTPLGTRNLVENERSSWIVEPQIVYKKQLKDHHFNAVLGATFQESKTATTRVTGSGYTSDALLNTLDAAPKITSSSNDFQYRYSALFARLGYDYAGKYIVNLTARRDGSSKFGPANRFGNFGAVGAGWIFTNEKLLAGSNLLSFGKLRTSYGVTGNDQIGYSEYVKRYGITQDVYHGRVSFQPLALLNPDYKWEVTRKLEFALELGLLNDRLSVEAAWYRNRSKNQLVDYPLPATTGFLIVTDNFDAIIQNTGWEFVVHAKNIQRKNFSWSTSFNLTLPRNKLFAFDDIANSSYNTLYKVGEPLSIKRTYVSLGVNPATGLYDFKDLNGDGAITTDDLDFTKAIAINYQGGLNNTISFRSFELSFLFQFSNSMGNSRIPGTPGMGNLTPDQYLDRWQKPGDLVPVQRLATSSNLDASSANSRHGVSDAAIGKIIFARLKTLTFSYTVPVNVIKQIRLESAKFFLQGQNLFTATNYTGWDPETLMNIPPLRILSFGIQVKI
ncbi:SusC/RagA family TonB-linked outer membrane protein [Chitinophaga sp. YIM B06452]|uniref:SusC/RagA family TonB-linked outer membrane protein n=1 Tax=Chitinophaga sp. YIM B06452 TaxID=3082158 RepID=UPI0031FE506E